MQKTNGIFIFSVEKIFIYSILSQCQLNLRGNEKFGLTKQAPWKIPRLLLKEILGKKKSTTWENFKWLYFTIMWKK